MVYELAITGFLWLIAAYLVCGLLFVIPFLLKGIHKIDETTVGSSWGFKIIIIPGVIACWPVLLMKWRKAV